APAGGISPAGRATSTIAATAALDPAGGPTQEFRYDRHADPQIPPVYPDQPAQPPVAGAGHRQSAAVVLGRSARRQPGTRRADGPRAQAPHVRYAGEAWLQGDRSRLPGRLG